MVGKGEIKFSTYERSTNAIKARFRKIKSSVEAIHATTTPLSLFQIKLLNTYAAELKRKLEDFDRKCDRIFEQDPDEVFSESVVLKDQDDINDSYAQIISVIETLLPSTEEPHLPSTSSLSSHNCSASQNIKLPQLDLKGFDGYPAQWVSFINLYDATVHQNLNLSNVMKMQYLMSCLTKEPLNLVKSLSISEANYTIAYQLLQDRYHNKRRLSTLHLNAVLDLPNITALNTKTLRDFINVFFEHTQSLKALECDITIQDNPLLSAHLLRKMDQELRRKLEGFRSHKECESHTLPSVDDIIKFLNEECIQTEDANLHQPQPTSKVNYIPPNRIHTSMRFKGQTHDASPRHVSLLSTPSQGHTASHSHPCFICNKTGHKVYVCELFKNKSPSERFKLVKSKQRCISCLGSHSLNKCTSKHTCTKCQMKHHTLLHFESKQTPQPLESPQESQSVSASAHSINTPRPLSHTTVLLGTTLVKLTSPTGHTHVFRALLDSGSMCDFISERAAQLLNTPRHRSTHTIVGISANSSQTKGFAQLKLATLSDHDIASQHSFHILDKISVDMPRTLISPEVCEKVKPYVLADPTFHLPSGIDVLLGVRIFPSLLTHQTHPIGPNMPYLIGTKFGFVVMGSAPSAEANYSSTCAHTSLLSTNDQDLHSSTQRYWTQEQVPQCSKYSNEEQLCDAHFSRPPFKANYLPLGTSYSSTQSRLHSFERKLATQPTFRELSINSSPYLAIPTFHQLAEDEGEVFPLAALKKQAYVDDITTSADTVTNALDLQNQLVSLLSLDGFELRKWSSHSKEHLQPVPQERLETPVFLEVSQEPRSESTIYSPFRNL